MGRRGESEYIYSVPDPEQRAPQVGRFCSALPRGRFFFDAQYSALGDVVRCAVERGEDIRGGGTGRGRDKKLWVIIRSNGWSPGLEQALDSSRI